MAALVDNEFYLANFYLKRSEVLFLKVMGVVEELENLISNLRLASTKVREISKKIVKI